VTTQLVEHGCEFCAITREQDKSVVLVWENRTWLAFFPLHPATLGHTLIIPRVHVENLWQLEPPLDSDLIQAAIQIGLAIEGALAPDGMNLITSRGEAAEQSVPHLHLHILPRWFDDDFGPIWAASQSRVFPDQAEVAQLIQMKYQEALVHDIPDR
jgi:histidine triad (HIT) family protein